ncbi:MAG TPA: putative nucleotidyltransferase substrate binding domain-containing protein [Syntrophorhabdaceae bacterium]|nr:putative nucleotidyltransferase substrate binding domain-containing protein [Syntrophorhabdaceae bacterium]HOL05444.1 putative nucleotidyltransferase substrate binding domain-containing protein [Syntrophorhabdaceae bacterium]HOT42570.1 putative nucleotidyltransferase substrate binding domain-containing protein [Syntrophorhabdaceae bacterium]HPP41974.1 putative nucleotidyltransferase substrate binding domain-containing protein [Syntrophorhabdaceae bacterium]HQK45972.1 putative nucleotidyltran
MALNFGIVEKFVSDYRDIMQDKTLLRHDRYRILQELKEHLLTGLKDYEAFESELNNLVMDRVENTRSYDELKECHERAAIGVENFFLEEDSVTDVHDLFRIIRDAITIKVLGLVEEEMVSDGLGSPPVDYIWVGLGSEGRDEQTLVTDQDNLIVFEDADKKSISDSLKKTASMEGIDINSPEEIASFYFRKFAEKAVERLDQVGFEKCKGNVMPTNAKWFGSISTWKKKIGATVTNDYREFELLDIIILTDARLIKGKRILFDDLMRYFFSFLTENRHIMKEFVRTAVIMPTALTFFGNFKTEKEGEFKDKFNIKLTGWSPLILSVRMLALSNNIYETNTLKRIKILRDMGVIKKEMYNELVEAYLTFVRFRIINQINIRHDTSGESLSNPNYISPDMLGLEEKERIRKAMKTVETLQKYIQELLLFGQPM